MRVRKTKLGLQPLEAIHLHSDLGREIEANGNILGDISRGGPDGPWGCTLDGELSGGAGGVGGPCQELAV